MCADTTDPNPRHAGVPDAIRESGWNFPDAVWDSLSDYEKEFAVTEFSGRKSREYYVKRLEHLGFTGKGMVLDAACGIGQWTIALSELNAVVCGVDLNPGRLTTARHLDRNHGKKNCLFCRGNLEVLPCRDQSFDAVFCYGVFMFTDMEKTLSEFNRILKPGGMVYLNANCPGWYLHLFLDRGLLKRNFSMIKSVLDYLIRTLKHERSNVIVTERRLLRMVSKNGFQVVQVKPEGTISIQPGDPALPERAYPPSYYGFRSIVEILAKKVG
jgi:ubiquinone/menaquinone biosynthesis C-methylase UbiE